MPNVGDPVGGDSFDFVGSLVGYDEESAQAASTLQLRRQDCVIVAYHIVGVECDACCLGGSW